MKALYAVNLIGANLNHYDGKSNAWIVHAKKRNRRGLCARNRQTSAILAHNPRGARRTHTPHTEEID